MENKTLKQFIKDGGKIEFGNPDHFKMYVEAVKEQFTPKELMINISVQCPYCGHEEENQEFDYDTVDSIIDLNFKEKELEQVDSETMELWKRFNIHYRRTLYKCDNCNKYCQTN